MDAENDSNLKNYKKLLEILNQISIGFQTTLDDLEISKFDQGMVSEIYRIVFKDKQNLPILDGEKIEQVVIKLFRPDPPYNPNESKLSSLIIGTNDLGPKVYLIGDDYLVMEYLDAKPFTRDNDLNEKYFELLARSLAKFHSLQVPIEKNTLEQRFKHIFEEWADETFWNHIYGTDKSFIDSLVTNGCHRILNNNVRDECEFLREKINKIDPFIVFCHQDLNHSNIFISTINDEIIIKFIDFDYSGYNHRCMDIGRYFADCEKYEQFSHETIINDDKMMRFIKYYLDENYKIYGEHYFENDDPDNLARKLLNESKLFVLLAQMIDILFCLWEAIYQPNHRSKYCIWAESRYKEYQAFKKRIKSDNAFL